MPYEVARDSSCPTSRPWACRKQGGGKVMGCHPSKAAAQAQMRALYANEPAVTKGLTIAPAVRARLVAKGILPAFDYDESKHPRGPDGRWGPGDSGTSDEPSKEFIQHLLDNPEGFTVDPTSGKDVTSGISVGVDNRLSTNIENDEAHRQAIVDYIKSVRDAAKTNTDVKLGGWLDKSTNQFTLDHVQVFPSTHQGFSDAWDKAQQTDQKAIFHLDSLTEIQTGGTGQREPTASRVSWEHGRSEDEARAGRGGGREEHDRRGDRGVRGSVHCGDEAASRRSRGAQTEVAAPAPTTKAVRAVLPSGGTATRAPGGATMADMTSTIDADDDQITAGGMPSKGTKKDKRLAENDDYTDAADETTAIPDDIERGTPFNILLVVEGLESSDGRMLEMGTTSWRDLPIPLMVQDTGTHGPGQQPAPSWVGGQITEIERDPDDQSRIMGKGYLMPGEVGDRAETLLRHGARGVSIDGYSDSVLGPEVQPTAVDQDGNPVDVLVRFTDTVIHRVTVVPTPAFACCMIWFDDEDMPEAAMNAHGTYVDPDTEPEVIDVPPNSYELLVASGGGPLNPPREWFFTPEPTHRQEMIVTPDGHLTGHLVGFGECHIGYTTCEQAPPSRTNPPFVGFHRTEAHCADGTKVACGWIPVNTNHSKLLRNGHREAERWSQDQTWEHYENSGTLIAKVRASNGVHGIWLSGALLPQLSERELSITQGLSVSGHWNVYTDPRDGSRHADELLAVLGGVSMPGYPETRTRPELLVASGGEVLGHVGLLPCDGECDDCEEMTPMSVTEERIAALEATVAALAAKSEDITFVPVYTTTTTGTSNSGNFTVTGIEMVAATNTTTMPAEDGEADPADGPDADIEASEESIADLARIVAGYTSWGKYSADELRAMQKKGQAMPPASEGGMPRYPIGDGDDFDNAVNAVGRAGGGESDRNAVRRHIIKNAARVGKTDAIPATWDKSTGALKTK